MKKDNDTIRSLLLEAENSESPRIIIPWTQSSDQSDIIRAYNAELLCDVGLFDMTSKDVYRLTNSGHEFIAAIRSQDNWQKMNQLAGHLPLLSMKKVGEKIIAQEFDDIINSL